MKIALIHEWLVDYSGSERVLEQLIKAFPSADVFCIVDFVPETQRHFLGGKQPRPSFIQRLPRAKKHYRNYLPLMPIAIEQHDLSSYDLVISSSHAVAKGVLTGPDQLHISYVHSPIRYAWDLQHKYLAEAGLLHGFKSKIARLILHYVRMWDTRTAHGVDVYVANSTFIKRRIRKVYGRDSVVVHPPVDTTLFSTNSTVKREEFYLAASRMVPYKLMPTIVEAFNEMPDKHLVVIGDGPDFDKVKSIAKENVTLLGYVEQSVLIEYMQKARAFVFAAEEDFGIAPVEAQACGTPVIAYGKGGVLDTVVPLGASDQPTGVFFQEQSPASIKKAVSVFEKNATSFSPQFCRDNASKFSVHRFREKMIELVEQATSIGTRI